MGIFSSLFSSKPVEKRERVVSVQDGKLFFDEHSARFGTQDFTMIADVARQNGFTVNGFSMTDHYLEPLECWDSESISDDLIEMLDEHGIEEVHAAMNDEFKSYYIDEVELRHTETKGFYTIYRDGSVRAPDEDILLDLIRKCDWMILR
jgi:hypothetical protein